MIPAKKYRFNMNKRVFFRDDDVHKLTKKFLKFHRIFMKEKLPISYAVIPGKINRKTADFLIQEKGRNPGLISIIQHGWMHEKCEFGDKRGYRGQRKDILRGRERMKKLFGRDFEEIFAPPYHEFNETTLKIVQELGFKGFSSYSDKRIGNNRPFANIPVSVSATIYGRRQRILSFRAMLSGFLNCCQRQNTIGILFHHEDIPEERVGALELFLKYIKKTCRKNPMEFSRIEDAALQETQRLTDICFEVTNRCNLKCRMCSIWKEDAKRDLAMPDIKGVMDNINGSVSVSLTGGECFLNQDINRIYRLLYLLYLKRKVGSIHLTTNGYSGGIIRGFFSKNASMLAPLSLGISLDGMEKNHDIQRGVKGAFKNTLQTIKTLRLEYPQIPITLKFTITPLNYRDILGVYRLSERLGCYFEPKLAEKMKEYYNRAGFDRSVSEFPQETIAKIRDSLKSVVKDMGAKGNHRSRFNIAAITTIIKFLESGRKDFIKSCRTPFKSLFISCSGDVYSCLYYRPIGNINTDKIREMLQGTKNDKIRNLALKGRCRKCLSYHGFLRDFNLESE